MMVVCNSPPNPITVTITVTSSYNGKDISCNGSCDGEITVTASSSSGGPFLYELQNSGLFSGQTVYSGLCVGNYTVEVIDLSQEIVPGSGQFWNCAEDIDVNEPPIINFGTNLIIDPSCPGFCDGQAFVSTNGGTGTLQINWLNSEVGSSPVMMCTGANLVTITDDNGCIRNDSVVILAPSPIQANMDITDLDCFGVCAGAAISNPSGGNGDPFSFSWSHDASISIDSAGALCAGNYTLTMADMDGCLYDTTFTITEPLQMTTSLVAQTNLICFNECIGSLTLQTMNGMSPHTYQWIDNITGLPVAGQDNDEIADNLCAGEYYAIITDQLGCVIQSPVFTITQPTEIIPTVNFTDVLCFGECTGTASASAVGGSPMHIFTWINNSSGGGVIGSGPNINFLCTGDYILQAQDQVGCIVQSSIFTVSQPSLVEGSVVTTDPLCAGQCNGIATVTPSGGTIATDYNISWYTLAGTLLSTGTSHTINTLCDGDHFVVITDDNACDDTVFFSIDEPLPILLNPMATEITCHNICNGSIDSDPSGGVGGFTFQWSSCAPSTPISGATNQIVNNLCPGDYFVQVTDANGCQADNSANCVTLSNPPALDIVVTNSSNATCGGACDGQGTATASGGTGTLNIVWHNGNTNSIIGVGNSINTLCAGTYYAVVTDDNGCMDTSAILTINDAVVVSGSLTVNDATCIGDCDGSASVLGAGGLGPYTYEWVEVLSGTVISVGLSNSISGLCEGNYSVQLFDVNNCSSPPIAFSIVASPLIIPNLTTTDVSCFGECDGTATSMATGGTGTLLYTWSPSPGAGQSTPNATQICAGMYQLSIVDDNGCDVDTTFTIIEPLPFDFTTTITHETCPSDCDGTIAINLTSGGSGAITYIYTPAPLVGQGTANASGFCPGNYSCVITDDNGCDSTFSFIINPAIPISLVVDVTANSNCSNTCDGLIQAITSGGTGTLSYNWSPNPTTGQGTNTISDLCTGTYDVTVTDDNGCFETGQGVITAPPPFDVTVSSTNLICNGVCDGTATVVVNSGGTGNYNYLWDDNLVQNTPTAVGLCAQNYTVIVSDANGCDTTIGFTITEPPLLTINAVSISGSCFGTCTGEASVSVSGGTTNYSIQWFDASTNLPISAMGTSAFNLCAGDYYAIVTDGASCTETSNTITIIENPPITATTATTLSNCVICDGTAILTVSGGSGTFTNYTWTPAPLIGQGTPNGSSMCAGVYSVLVQDTDGCTEAIPVTIDDNTAEVIVPTSTDVLCFGDCTGTATATVNCGVPSCSFQWFGPGGIFLPGQTGTTITDLCAGDYSVQVTNGAGCTSTESYIINDGNPIDLTTSFTDPQCAGDNTGSATVSPTGGAGGFSFNWSPSPLSGQNTKGLLPEIGAYL